MPKIKILSAVPKQEHTIKAKLKWLEKQCKKDVDIVVTPQEFFGGAVINPDGRKTFKEKELLPLFSKMAKTNDTAIVVGVEEDFGDCNKEAVWIIDEKGKLIDKYFKFALPAYDHVCTKGFGDVVPETNFDNRLKTTELRGMFISVVFCWEVYCDVLWCGLGLLQPDVVFSMIKFGVNAWPKVKPNKQKIREVVGFGYGTWAEEGRWIERLRVASLWQVKCPIINSTNSWDLRPVSMPLCGSIVEIPGQLATDQQPSFWHPLKEQKLKIIPEKIVIDELDTDRIRGSVVNKHLYADAVGEFPPYSIGRLTMFLKINRVTNRILSGREQRLVEKKLKESGGGWGL